MYEINDEMFEKIDDENNGHFSVGWVRFKEGSIEIFEGKNVLIKFVPGYQPDEKYVFFPINPNFNIQLSAINSLVAEIVSQVGDKKGSTANYFLVKKGDRVFICTPSFKSKDEDLIEGKDILKPEHKNLTRANPYDVLVMKEDLRNALELRKIPSNQIEEIINQFIKDCFKCAYMGMWDKNNANWGILYKGIARARIAPLYDLDIGFNIPIEYGERLAEWLKKYFDCYKTKLMSGEYIKEYTSVIHNSGKFPWFINWVKEWIDNLSNIDLEQLLKEKKGIDIQPEQLQHYRSFFESQNKAICEQIEILESNLERE